MVLLGRATVGMAEKEAQGSAPVERSKSDCKEKEVNAEDIQYPEVTLIWSEDKGGAGKNHKGEALRPQITTLLFDVDDTLYPRSCGLSKVMGEALEKYVSEHVDMSTFPPLSELPPPFETYNLNQSRMEPPPPASGLQAKLKEYYRRFVMNLV